MEYVSSVMDFLKSPEGAAVLGGLLVLSEALGGISSIKQNSIYQIALTILGKLVPKKDA